MSKHAELLEGLISITQHRDHVAVIGRGLWTIGYVDEHFALLERLLQEVRAQTGGAVVLVDLSRASVQPATIAERVAYWTARLYGGQDRVAIVVASSLLKVQMRRVVSVAHRELFLSHEAAVIWLLPDAAAGG